MESVKYVCLAAALAAALAGGARAQKTLLQDDFSNGRVQDSESVVRFWNVVTDKKSGDYVETIEPTEGELAGHLVLGAGRSKAPLNSNARVVTALSEEFNPFLRSVEIQIDGLRLVSEPVTAGGPTVPADKIVFALEVTGDGESSWKSQDGWALEITGENRLMLGWKNDRPKFLADKANVVLRQKIAGPISDVRLRLSDSNWAVGVVSRDGEKSFSGTHDMKSDMWDGGKAAIGLNLHRMTGAEPGSRVEASIDRIRVVGGPLAPAAVEKAGETAKGARKPVPQLPPLTGPIEPSKAERARPPRVDLDVPFDARDEFGGWKGVETAATGCFRVEKIDGRWWLISPRGHGMIFKSVTGVQLGGNWRKPYREAMVEKYGSEQAWALAVAEELRSWGFNGVGAWHDEKLRRAGINYAENIGFWLCMPAQYPPELKGKHFHHIDFWDPRFEEAADKLCREVVAPHKDDPRLVGWHTDNELEVTGYHYRGFHPYSMLRFYLRLPAAAPGHQKAVDFLRERYGNDYERFSKVWNTGADSFDEMARADDLQVRVNDRDRANEDISLYLERLMARYAKVCHDAIRRYDPNHLILGIRHGGLSMLKDDRAVKAQAPYIDVLSINSYKPAPPIVAFDYYSQLIDRPVMVTEVGFRGADEEPPESAGGLPNQAYRSQSLELYLRGLMTSPAIVGYQYFNFLQGFQGKNYGIVRQDGTAYEEMNTSFRRFHPVAEFIHAGGRLPLAPELARIVIHPAPE